MPSIPYTVLRGGPQVAWAPLLIAALTFYNHDSSDSDLRVKNTPIEDILPKYDFIIVGGGSAGCVLANRLTEIEDWSVLLLEAGGDETEISDVPFLARDLTDTNLDWQFKTEPSNTSCLAQNDTRCDWPRGKLLGGSSSINGVIYVRGNKKDYDRWESLGNPGWSYNDVLPYFKKSENMTIPELENSPYHSTSGPLTISQSSYGTPLGPAFLQAVEEIGYPILDYNGEFQTGFMKTQFTIRDGHRCSAAKAFLSPASSRHNLQISKRSHVTKLLIDSATKIAYGVKFKRKGSTYEVTARKEVILSAGAIQSPQLLMLSGIGPKKHLEKFSIPVLQDLKVGYNLQDQPGVDGIEFLINETFITDDKRLRVQTAVKAFAKSGKGILTFPNFEALGNIHTKYVNASEDWPDVQLGMFPSAAINTSSIEEGQNRTRYSDGSATEPTNAWGIFPCLNRAISKGRLKLHSKNPFDYPILINNYFKKKIDLLRLVEGVKIAVNLSKTNAMQQFGSMANFTYPNCAHFPLYGDAYWECAIRYNTRSGYHQVGTCKMGPEWDPEAVVDPQLRVYGIKRLRVIDASIMPVIPHGNVNAPTIMIAEKGADFIKKAYGYRTCP